MGKVVGAITKPAFSLASSLTNPILKPLGLGLEGEQGEFATPEQAFKRAYEKAAADYTGEMGRAEKGVQESALTKDLFGQGGLQSQLAKEQQQLSGQGFALTPEDMTAYGQTSGDISRLFGQQEQGAAKALARRGLGSASSGAAGAMFSGLAGNKNEMLAKAQTDIAQRRYQDTANRLQNTRNMMQSLGGQGAGLARERYGDRMAGLAGASGSEGIRNAENARMLEDKKAAYNPGLLGTIGQGLQTGVGSLAAKAPGMLLGGAAGGGAGGSALGGTQNTFAGQPTSMFTNRSYA